MKQAQLKKRPANDAAPDSAVAEAAPRPAPAPASAPVAAPIVVLSNPMGAPAEAIRAVRTKVQSQHIQLGRRALAICAASPEVGATFVAVNLAVALSQIGIKTLLIDGNLRDPTVQNYFQEKDTSGGLQACLSSSDVAMADCVHEEILPNLDVIFAGEPSPQAQELIASDSFPLLINTCLRNYEITIVDTPAANRCADGLRISSVLGFSLIVARKDRSLVSDVRTLANELKRERAAVVGTVLNDI